MNKIIIYNHGGSENHGCEALVRTVLKLIDFNNKNVLLTESPQQDIRYKVNEIISIEPALSPVKNVSFSFFKAYVDLKFKHDYFSMDYLPYKKGIKHFNQNTLAISIGGDIYCYDDFYKYIKYHHEVAKKAGGTVLLGCSLSPELFENQKFINDMKKYTFISARESLTYDLLKKAGIQNVGLYPDTAFTLPVKYKELPKGFIEGNTIGINLSPLVEKRECEKGIVLKNYEKLIQFILDTTDCSIALVPHVIWESNDDRTVLKKLFEKFEDSQRVVLIRDCNCMELKGYISRCRFFIGARTHATIAAYSTCVPTLVLGYSIKSRGIAKDLFGTYDNYVIGVEELTDEDKLMIAFQWIMDNEKDIKDRLETFMPEYILKVDELKNKICSLTYNR